MGRRWGAAQAAVSLRDGPSIDRGLTQTCGRACRIHLRGARRWSADRSVSSKRECVVGVHASGQAAIHRLAADGELLAAESAFAGPPALSAGLQPAETAIANTMMAPGRIRV